MTPTKPSGAERESFTKGRPWTVTAEDLKKPWSGKRDGSRFRCVPCGHRFEVGDVARFQWANFKDSPWPGGNFFVCVRCDGPDLLKRMGALWRESRERFAWLWERVEDAEDNATYYSNNGGYSDDE